MKKILYLSLFLLCLNISFGQIMSLKDLLKINQITFDEFHTYARQKKYKFYQVEDDENISGFSYAYGQSKSNKYATRVLTKYQYKKNKKHAVLYQTLTSGDYFNFNNQLAGLKFQFIHSRLSKAGTNFLIYRKGNIEVSLTTDQGYDSNGSKIPYYQVLVSGY